MRILGALTPLLFFCASNVRAFVIEVNDAGDALRWHLNPTDPGVHTNVVNPTTKAIRYFLASDAWSATNTAAELNAVRASFAQWQAIPGTILKFEEGGLVAPGVDVNTSDNTNVVFWTKNTTLVNGGFDNISGALAVTFNSFFPDNNAQAEADIVFNGKEYTWFTDFNYTGTGSQFVESTATHEIGHFLGLKHSPVGGATMLYHGGGGVNIQAGLSSDEIAAAKWLYGQPATLASLGRLRGSVTMNGTPVFGAVVTVEDASSGNVVAGTVTGTNGTYDLPALPPGQYGVRVAPLDPTGASAFLIRGRDINSSRDGLGNYAFDSVQTSFLPTTNVPVTLTANSSVTRNFSVTGGNPAFRVTRVRGPTGDSNAFVWSSLPVSVRPGLSSLFVGVGSADLPTSNATLTVTGDGLSVGPPIFDPNALNTGMNFISVQIAVSSNATPGLRSFIVQRGNGLACANGFLEVQPPFPDFNFDGLDDRFQRQYFPLFTAPDAAPGEDPDADSFDNRAEYIAGTDPTNALSLLKIASVVLDGSGSTVTWESAPGKRYQVWSRRDVVSDPWQTVGPPVIATGASAQFTDASATNGFRFYQVQVLP